MWVNNRAAETPTEWVVYKLCERFHKLPEEIYAMPYEHYTDLLACMDMDRRIKERESRRNTRLGRGRR